MQHGVSIDLPQSQEKDQSLFILNVGRPIWAFPLLQNMNDHTITDASKAGQSEPSRSGKTSPAAQKTKTKTDVQMINDSLDG